jgi:L-serine deaminase
VDTAAVKALTAAQLAMASDGVYSVSLDEAIAAMRLTAADMSVKYKETSLSVSRLGSAIYMCRLTDKVTYRDLR